MLRVIIADSHRASRDVVRALLEMQDEFEVVGEADNGPEAIAMYQELRPDVVVADSELSGMKALRLTQRLTQHSAANVVILSSHFGEAYAAAALEAGAKAWIPKEQAVEELASAMRAVQAGDTYLGLSLTQEAIDAYTRQAEETPADSHHSLTSKESQILTLIGSGWSDLEIGEGLCLSHHAVRRHRASMLRKLGLTTDAELRHYALERNLNHRVCLEYPED